MGRCWERSGGWRPELDSFSVRLITAEIAEAIKSRARDLKFPERIANGFAFLPAPLSEDFPTRNGAEAANLTDPLNAHSTWGFIRQSDSDVQLLRRPLQWTAENQQGCLHACERSVCRCRKSERLRATARIGLPMLTSRACVHAGIALGTAGWCAR